MKKIFVALSMVALLAACDDSSSASAENNEPTTLSSAEEQGSSSSSSFTSAGSVTLSSSSRHCEECNDEAISSSIEELNGTSSSSSEKVKPQSSSSEKFGKSSSSVIETSLSSEKLGSSSSVEIPNSSSSELSESSSSSADARLSSSETAEKSSSSSKNVELCSSSRLEEVSSNSLNGFDWNLPKETYLNPEIEYDTIIDSRDGKVYKIVKIGSQVWMAENLNFDPGQGGSGDSNYVWTWCYNNEPKNCDVAGRLYTWQAAFDSLKFATDADFPQDCGYLKICTLPTKLQGICPDGWHLPTYSEWETLFRTVGGYSTAGEMLKSRTGWSGCGNGTDAYGFSALPVGSWNAEDAFHLDGGYAFFWGADRGSSSSYRVYFGYDSKIAYSYVYDIHSGYSVRCLKD